MIKTKAIIIAILLTSFTVQAPTFALTEKEKFEQHENFLQYKKQRKHKTTAVLLSLNPWPLPAPYGLIYTKSYKKAAIYFTIEYSIVAMAVISYTLSDSEKSLWPLVWISMTPLFVLTKILEIKDTLYEVEKYNEKIIENLSLEMSIKKNTPMYGLTYKF